jgi:hypothetical protein
MLTEKSKIIVLIVAAFVFGICLGILIDEGYRKSQPQKYPIYLHTGDLSIPIGGR